jgi:DnaK suppressor protein
MYHGLNKDQYRRSCNMIGANKEGYRQMLKEFKKSSLSSSRTSMRNLMSGESRLVCGSGMDDGDVALQNQFEHMVCRQITAQRATIKEIEAAMERLDEGSYGICDECGNEITEGRLKIVPFAKYCKICQEDRELIRTRQ